MYADIISGQQCAQTYLHTPSTSVHIALQSGCVGNGDFSGGCRHDCTACLHFWRPGSQQARPCFRPHAGWFLTSSHNLSSCNCMLISADVALIPCCIALIGPTHTLAHCLSCGLHASQIGATSWQKVVLTDNMWDAGDVLAQPCSYETLDCTCIRSTYHLSILYVEVIK